MTKYEAYQEHIRYTHDTYCRIVIRHASFDAARMLAARWKREISLAAALAGLPKQTQEEIFLYYFQHLTQKEIGEQSGWTRSTIGRHIQLALKRLKEEMEVLPHE